MMKTYVSNYKKGVSVLFMVLTGQIFWSCTVLAQNITTDFKSVKEYGIVGDGSDETTEFQTAVNSAHHLYIPQGMTIGIADSISIPVNTQICGKGTLLLLAGNPSDVAYLMCNSNTTISDITIDGSNVTNIYKRAVNFSESSNICVRDVTFSDMKLLFGIVCSDCSEIFLRNNNFANSRGGIRIAGTGDVCHDIVIDGNIFNTDLSYVGVLIDPIYLEGEYNGTDVCERLVVTNNIIKGAIRIGICAELNAVNGVIGNNVIKDCRETGIHVEGGGGATAKNYNLVISGNQIDNCQGLVDSHGWGIGIGGTATNVAVNNNVITNALIGVYLAQTINTVVVSGNTIKDCTNYGICLWEGKFANITGNNVSYCGIGITGNPIKECNISENYCHHNKKNGIKLTTYVYNSKITNNFCNSNNTDDNANNVDKAGLCIYADFYYAFKNTIVSNNVCTKETLGLYIYDSQPSGYSGFLYSRIENNQQTECSTACIENNINRSNVAIINSNSSASRPGLSYGSAAPATGIHTRNEIVYNTAPSAGGYIGWVCTTSGTPGTWKGFGAIAP